MFKTITLQSLLGALVAAIFALLITTQFAYADDVTVSNSNSASVSNSAYVGASTGGNDTNGGDGDDGGNGGSAEAETGDAVGGVGGAGGTGGNSGSIITGAALAIGTVDNDINRNVTRVTGCGCDEEPLFPFFWFGGPSDDVNVENQNEATVQNELRVKARTGGNDTNGGDGDDGGNGGSADTTNAFNWWWWVNMGDGNATGGNGGAGGNGGTAGAVTTGVSQADGLITNLINRNITRVTRD